jgi:outer membrane protein assembly factor BamB
VAETGWAAGSQARVEAVVESEQPPPDRPGFEWVLAPNGRARYALTDDGFLLAQKKCARCPAGWRRRWQLRVSGVGLAPPLVTEKRIFYGSLDNRVYGLKRRNGHRLWEIDLEGRVSRPLRQWRALAYGSDPEGAARDPSPPLILVVPDDGGGIVALDARSGAKVAAFDLPEDGGTLVGAPLVTPDGGIVVARQKYTPADASLMVFRLVAAPQPA